MHEAKAGLDGDRKKGTGNLKKHGKRKKKGGFKARKKY